MRAREILTEAKRSVGRNLQHLEDLVFVDGSEGANEALDILERFGSDVGDVSIKWDGTPAVIFGRDEQGNFILTDIAGFNSKSYNGRVTSAQDLQKMILSRGKEVDDNRRAYAQQMANVWDAFESSVPNNFRGFIHGDLLYKERPPVDDSGHYIFKPNKVTYRVRKDSNIGSRIDNSKAGVVIHTHTNLDGSVQQADAKSLQEGSLFIMPPVLAQRPPKIDTSGINQIRNVVSKNASAIDALLRPQAGLSDIKNIIYTYVNQMSRAGRWDDLPTGFEEWLKNSKVSANKQAKILAMPESKHFPLLFDLVLKIQAIKNNVIKQLDDAEMDVEASIDGDRGGEGYVAARDKVKLVPRHKFRIG
jgi:hypothetical protein